MNDLPWYQYDPQKMFSDTADMSRETELAHRRLCDVLAIQAKPLTTTDDVIRELGRVKEQDWQRVRGELAFKGWSDNGPGWTHGGMMKTIQKSIALHESKVKQTEAARLAKLSVTTPVTECVTKDVTAGEGQASVTEGEREREVQVQGQGEKEPERDLKLVAADAPPPATKGNSDEDWLQTLSASKAYEGIEVLREYAKMQVWCDTNRKKPTHRRFLSWLNRCEKPMAAPTGGPLVTVGQVQAQYRALNDEIEVIKARTSRDPFGKLDFGRDTAEKQHFIALCEKRKAVRTKLQNIT